MKDLILENPAIIAGWILITLFVLFLYRRTRVKKPPEKCGFCHRNDATCYDEADRPICDPCFEKQEAQERDELCRKELTRNCPDHPDTPMEKIPFDSDNEGVILFVHRCGICQSAWVQKEAADEILHFEFEDEK